MSAGLNKPNRVAVFISGGGSTLQALLEMHHQLDIRLVVSTRRNAPGVLKASRFGKKIIIQTKEFTLDQVSEVLKLHGINTIILAGYMKLLSGQFVDQWKNKIFNIHPSLLPDFPGLNAAERNFADAKPMGVTIHSVTAEMDAGPQFLRQGSLKKTNDISMPEALLLLRRTEQHLLRELAYRMGA